MTRADVRELAYAIAGSALIVWAAMAFQSCASARAEGRSAVTPAPPAAPIVPGDPDSADAPHPVNPDGSKAHSWMTDGTWVWRCWFCNVVKRR